MKFILNKDTLEIENIEYKNSGSINYYEVEVEYDDSWNDLVIEVVMVKKDEEIGTSIAVINNKFFIDKNLSGTYYIGCVGYTIKDNKKTYQISSDLQRVYFEKGAGEIETELEDLPTASEWEIYIAQIKSIVSDIEGLTDKLNSKVEKIENKLENGDFDGVDGKDATINGENAIEIEAGNNIIIDETENGIKINAVGSGVSTVINTDTNATITLANSTEYRRNEIATLEIILPTEIAEDFISSLVFTSGTTATQVTVPENIKWSGDSVNNNEFTPEVNKTYNIIIWNDGTNINGIARGV